MTLAGLPPAAGRLREALAAGLGAAFPDGLPSSPLLVAVSGGADSVALLHLLVELRCRPLVIFHLDHALRRGSAEDARFVQGLSGSLGLPCVVRRTPIRPLARRLGLGLEEAARQERYRQLAVAAGEVGAAAVVTAHHRDDQIETVLMHLLRGSGALGARGMALRRDTDGVAIVRPLLAVGRADLLAYLRARALPWREDASNSDERFRRNHLRHRVLPLLEAGVPGSSGELLALATQAGRTGPLAHAGTGEGEPLADELRGHGITPTRQLVRDLLRLARGARGGQRALAGWVVTATAGGVLAWTRAAAPEEPRVALSCPGSMRRCGAALMLRLGSAPARLLTPAGQAWMDAAAVRWPLQWRNVRRDDRWQRLGSVGHQTVMKSLADRKVPLPARGRTAVIADAEGVVWVPGIGIAERVRIHAASTVCLQGWWLAGEDAALASAAWP